MSRKSLDRILNDVDEPEESLDTEQKVEEVRAEPVKTDETDGDDLDEPEKTAATEEKPSDKAGKDEGDDKKDGLPPWMHARVKSATEAKTAAERRAEEAEARLAEYERRSQGQQQEQPQHTLEDVLSDFQMRQQRQIKDMQIASSVRLANSEFGAEEVQRAMAWATDRCSADPQFNQQMWDEAEPAFLAVKEFRKAQTYAQLEQYGGDIDKLIEAKLAERGQIQTDERASPQAQPQTQRKMPGNFSGSPSAQTGRAGPAFSGPTPLSDLLNN